MSSKGLVLISGVNGFIASRTAESFLKAGYSVRGTVRSLSSGKALQNVLAEYASSGKFELAEVPDITVDGAFDEAVKGTLCPNFKRWSQRLIVIGVHAIAHMASPVSLSFTDPEPVMHTAVVGTTSILDSALKAGPQLKTVVIISSIAAVVSPKEPPYTYTEKDWNSFSEGEVERLGKQTPSGHIYRASKTAAERAFWKFRDEKKPSFSMTAINPW
jgi:nucleoside-diphosphate-sugar epimerase